MTYRRGQENSQGCAAEGQEAALHQQLPGNAAARRSQRQPQRRFSAAGKGAGEAQIRHVQTSQEQDEGGSGQEYEEAGAPTARLGPIVPAMLAVP